MLTTVEGTYQDGVVRLDEPAPLLPQTSRKVLVTFLEPARADAALPANSLPSKQMAALLDSWERSRTALAGTTGSSLSEEVLAERREEDE